MSAKAVEVIWGKDRNAHEFYGILIGDHAPFPKYVQSSCAPRERGQIVCGAHWKEGGTVLP